MEITVKEYGRVKDDLQAQRGNASLSNVQLLNAFLNE